MKLRKHLQELSSIYETCGGVVAETARIFCANNNLVYSDSFRRKVSKILSTAGVSKNQQTKSPDSEDGKWEEDVSKDSAYLEKVASEKVKSLEDLVRICNIDLKVWEIERWVCNTWGVTAFRHSAEGTYRTNYQVKVWLKKRSISLEEGISKVLKVIEKYSPKPLRTTVGDKKHIVASMADFHIGADITSLVRTPDFNVEILLKYINFCVDKINSYNASKVSINLLGDFYESISGMNHENTFKSLGKDLWGANVIIIANEIIATHLLGKINNLVQVNMISGNHDRMTATNKLDNTGEGAKILWHMLRKDFPLLEINYSNSVLTKEIDGINYILTHGDKSLSKKEISKVVFDYGDPNLFNLLLEGHLHTRKTVKALTQKAKFYEEVEVVSLDEMNYRKINVASLFTGNFYSESLGFAGNAGMTISFNNQYSSKPEVHDITI